MDASRIILVENKHWILVPILRKIFDNATFSIVKLQPIFDSLLPIHLFSNYALIAPDDDALVD